MIEVLAYIRLRWKLKEFRELFVIASLKKFKKVMEIAGIADLRLSP